MTTITLPAEALAPERPALWDVARAADVSSATASKALNKRSDVREETRRRVEEVAAKLGYVPNPLARGLALRGSSARTVIEELEAERDQLKEQNAAMVEALICDDILYSYNTESACEKLQERGYTGSCSQLAMENWADDKREAAIAKAEGRA